MIGKNDKRKTAECAILQPKGYGLQKDEGTFQGRINQAGAYILPAAQEINGNLRQINLPIKAQ